MAEFFDDAGDFEPGADHEPAEDLPQPEVAVVIPGWTEQQVRQALTAQGRILHGLVAVDAESQEWVYTDNDLQTIAPALTRIANRYDALKAAAGVSDEVTVAMGLGAYSMRSWAARKAALARLRALEDDDAPFAPDDPAAGPAAAQLDDDDGGLETPPLRGHR